jgi:hypothetical protein
MTARGARVALLVVACGACRRRVDAPPPPSRAADLDRLAGYLRDVAAMDDAARRREIATWQLDEATFARTVQPVYRALYPDYADHFTEAIPALASALGPPRPDAAIVAKRHYADDATVTPSQFRIRWMLPTEYPTAIASRDGAMIDAVFAPMPDDRWGVLANLDALARAHVHAMAADCDGYLDRAVRTGHCGEVGWAIVDAAMRGDRARLDHACRLAAAACARGP